MVRTPEETTWTRQGKKKHEETERRFIVQTVRTHGDESAHLTRILTAAAVTGAHHLVINDDVDAIGPMPPLTEAIIDHGNVYRLQRLRSQSRT